MSESPIDAAIASAYELLRGSVVEFEGRPVGTVAAVHPDLPAENYSECFIRDFVPSAAVFLLDGESEIVKNFLRTVLKLHDDQQCPTGHDLVPGVMPASFRVVRKLSGQEELVADFGDRAIGRVAPVDSIMWWIIVLARYVEVTGDLALAHEPDFQRMLRDAMELLLRDTFEIYPTLLTPDASFMIDRRMGVYGHPLEIQSLFYSVLRVMPHLLKDDDEDHRRILDLVKKRAKLLRDYVRKCYWLDLARLNEIHRYRTEEFGDDAENVLNLSPESIPDWVEEWLPDDAGYLAGNIGPGRLDFRFFSLGNLVAVASGLATTDEARRILAMYDERWDDLIGMMPVKICFPAVDGVEWEVITGSDSKNAPWSYHNGGNWPTLLLHFTGAAIRFGREDLARRGFEIACRRLPGDRWPEYYDGRRGRLIGRRASLGQVWSASSLIVAHKILEDPGKITRMYSPEKTMK